MITYNIISDNKHEITTDLCTLLNKRIIEVTYDIYTQTHTQTERTILNTHINKLVLLIICH